jgi:hypothetical protein
MMRLEALINQEILLLMVNSEVHKSGTVILRGVESGGIWVESSYLSGMFSPQKIANQIESKPQPVFFVPFAQVRLLTLPPVRVSAPTP